MKKLLITLFCFSFLFSSNLVMAQQEQSQQGIHEAGTGVTNSELRDENQGTGQGLDYQYQATGTETQDDQKQLLNEGGQGLQGGNQEPVSRRSRISNASQFMLEVAERNQGVGQQIQNITQNQTQAQEEAENALESAQKRSGFMKFLIGPDYIQLKKVANRLEQHNQNLEQLKELKSDIESEEDVALFEDQIQTMEEIRQEMEIQLKENDSGFSLFGWMNRLFNY